MNARKLCLGLAASTVLAGGAAAATLDVAIDSSPAGLDPHLITAFNSAVIVLDNVYEGLTDLALDQTVIPGLAESWEVSEDGRSYTFHLKDDVTFHDGSAFDADDAAASLRRVLSEEIASPLASRISPVTGIEVLDPQTLRLTLDEPFAPILASLATIMIVPAEMETEKDALQQAPVGTGPFMFSDWAPNDYISLLKFDEYHVEGEPQVDEVRFHFVPDAATRQVGVTSGQYEILPGIDPATALQLQGQPGVTVQETRDLAYTLIGMNASREPFDDPKVREAVNMLLDREEIIQGALFGAGVPGGPLSPALETWALPVSEFPCYETDVEAAKALLAEAGVETPIQVTMNVLPRQDARDIAQVAQQQLAAGGIEVELLNQEIGQFVQDWRNSNFDMFVSANAGGPDPDLYFYRTFYGGGSTNVFKYDNPEVDALLDQGREQTDDAERKATYDRVQTILACQGPIAHIAYGTLFTAVSDKVEGFEINANARLSSLPNVTLAE